MEHETKPLLGPDRPDATSESASKRRSSLQGPFVEDSGLPSSISRRRVAALLFIIFGLAVSTCSVTFVLIARHYTPEGRLQGLDFRQFGMHPLLMVCAFGFCAPLATVSYQTGELFGLKRPLLRKCPTQCCRRQRFHAG